MARRPLGRPGERTGQARTIKVGGWGFVDGILQARQKSGNWQEKQTCFFQQAVVVPSAAFRFLTKGEDAEKVVTFSARNAARQDKKATTDHFPLF